MFSEIRMRRLRSNENLRRLVRETQWSVDNLLYPIFVVPGSGVRQEIPSMPGIYKLSVDQVIREVQEVAEFRIPGVLLFGQPHTKDAKGSESYSDQGVVQQAVRAIKSQLLHVLVATDVCLCAYTTQGHCGLVDKNQIVNDATLEVLAKIATSHAHAGADLISPSDMMDGRVAAIRSSLDEQGFSNLPIMAYSAKFSSAFYGPFRDAQGSTPQFGDRRSYQLDPANGREALREIDLDISEGADIVMVKPALAYLDVIARAKEITDLPIAAYQVSGEYAMIKAAAEKQWLDEEKVMMESLQSIRRAGASIIITYFAKEAARLLTR
ncbi:MAG: porphobilinogen synthase [Deltaproteobacteria bacterium]|nr:porphobilinogen synthase [Deltaproteobacteria bacterium]